MTCAACGRVLEEWEHAICCGARVCTDCWVTDRTCADVAACQTRQAEGVFAEVHDCKPTET